MNMTKKVNTFTKSYHSCILFEMFQLKLMTRITGFWYDFYLNYLWCIFPLNHIKNFTKKWLRIFTLINNLVDLNANPSF